jgi:hypothetical protein
MAAQSVVCGWLRLRRWASIGKPIPAAANRSKGVMKLIAKLRNFQT